MEPGHQIQQYVFVERLGEGGMAEVWKATDTHLDDFVAIKFLLPHIGRVAELQERFLNEGKRQAQLKHKNIVHVRQYLEHQGQFFLVMDYLEGGGLDKYLDEHKGPLSVDETLRISLPVLSALSLAHSKGVVHRDISPQNVLFDGEGVPYLTDFGIALVLGNQRVTRAGTVMGKPHYMSPEQILKPSTADHRTDIYSFGVLLYEMLAGGLPFDAEEGDVEHLVKNMHLNSTPPSLRERNSAVPAAIEAVVLWTLEKDPERRPQNCQVLAEALVQAEAGTMPDSLKLLTPLPETDPENQVQAVPEPAALAPGPVEPAQRTPNALPKIAGIIALLLALCTGGWWYWTRSGRVTDGTPKTDQTGASEKDKSTPEQHVEEASKDDQKSKRPSVSGKTERIAPAAPRPVIAFSAEPQSTGFDGAASVRWNVRHARQVWLDGKPVKHSGEITRRNLLADTVVHLTVVDGDGKSTQVPVTIHVASAVDTAVEACTKLGLSAARCRKNWDECRASGMSEKRCLDQSR
jgi:serine/threonine protein kinase